MMMQIKKIFKDAIGNNVKGKLGDIEYIGKLVKINNKEKIATIKSEDMLIEVGYENLQFIFKTPTVSE